MPRSRHDGDDASALLRPHLPVGRRGRRGAARKASARSPRSRPIVARGVPVIGLEPSCLLTFRDELPALLKSEAAQRAVASTRCCFEEFLAREQKAGRLNLPLGPLPNKALLHGHCHQKSFDAMGAVESVLRLCPELDGRDRSNRAAAAWPARSATAPTPSTSRSRWANCRCCRRCARRRDDALIVADGTSCRHQIHDGTGREALHVARVLAMSVAAAHGEV